MLSQPTLQTVFFDRDELQVVKNDGTFLVPLKPICKALKLDWEPQRKLIARDAVLDSTTSIMEVVGADGKQREMLCLPMKYLNGWLFKINPSRYEGEACEKIIKYQKECYDVLFSHFFPTNENHKTSAIEDKSKRVKAELTDKQDAVKYAVASIKLKTQAKILAKMIFKGDGSLEEYVLFPDLYDEIQAELEILNKNSLFKDENK